MGIILGVAIDVALLAVIALFVWLSMTLHVSRIDCLIGALGFDAVLGIGFLIAVKYYG